jgi:hypothetical protein
LGFVFCFPIGDRHGIRATGLFSLNHKVITEENTNG